MQRLSRLFSSSSTKEDARTLPPQVCPAATQLFRLPTEILLTIESYLQYENAVALSLSCRFAYDLLFNRQKPTPKHHGREVLFLRLLERDTPEFIACPIHERLYTWAKQKSKHYQCPLCIANMRTGNGSYVICNKGCKSSFYGIFEAERRLVLRRDALGPEYGISKSVLDHVCKRSYSNRTNEVNAKIVNGSLMIRRTHHYTVDIDFEQWDDFWINQIDEAICAHSQSEVGIRALICAGIVHVRTHRKAEATMPVASAKSCWQAASWHCPILFKCRECATDLHLCIDQISPRNIICCFEVFQDLGGLSNPSIAQRQVLATRHDWRSQRLSWVDKYTRMHEDLRKRWNGESEDLELASRGLRDLQNVGFLSQWTYRCRHNPESPVLYRPDCVAPTGPADDYGTLKFDLVEG